MDYNEYKEMARKLLASGSDTEDVMRMFTDAVNEVIEEQDNQTQYNDAIYTLVNVWNDTVEAYCNYKGIEVNNDYYMTKTVMQDMIESTLHAVDLAHKITNAFSKNDKNAAGDFEKAITDLLSGIIN